MQVVGFMGHRYAWGYTRVMRCGVLRADLVVVSKKKREMLLLRGESMLRTYRIALGPEPEGPKRQEGDGRNAARAVRHRPAERAQQVPSVAAYFVRGCGGRSARARGGGRPRRGHHDTRSGGRGPAGGRLDAGVYRGDGRGDGRDLGAGGRGHADLDKGMTKRTQLDYLFSMS